MYATDGVEINATSSSFSGLIYISNGDMRWTGSDSTSYVTVVAAKGIRVDGNDLIFIRPQPCPIATRGQISLVE
jgi:hypothetical protein